MNSCAKHSADKLSCARNPRAIGRFSRIFGRRRVVRAGEGQVRARTGGGARWDYDVVLNPDRSTSSSPSSLVLVGARKVARRSSS